MAASPLSTINTDITPGIVAQNNMPTYDRTAEQLRANIEAGDTAAAALEKRYENPNWFNVAAGFLKPQLGGFAASLGSANQAMGEWLDQKRANEIPTYVARSQVALMKAQREQKMKAADLARSAITKPGGLTAEDVANAGRYDEDYGKSMQQQFSNQQTLRKEIAEQYALGRTDAELRARYGPGFDNLFPSGVGHPSEVPKPSSAGVPGAPVAAEAPSPNKWAAPMPQQSAPPVETGLRQDQWDAMSLPERTQLLTSLGEHGTKTTLDSEAKYRNAAEAAQPKLVTLKGMRELAASPDMEPVFGILAGDDLISLAGKALSEGRLGERLGRLDSLLTNANIKDPDVRRRAHELIKLINENKAQESNSSSVTDQATALRGASNPSLDNPRTAFIALTDAMAHTARNHMDMFGILNGNNPEKKKHRAPDFMNSDAWKNKTRSFMKRHGEILAKAPLDTTPDFYYPDSQPAMRAPAPSSRVPTSTEQSPGGSTTRARLAERMSRIER